MSKVKIIVVSLVKNDDLWIAKALEAVQHFADEIIVLDNESKDKTVEIASKYASEIYPVVDLKTSHEWVQKYLGQEVWVFGVDGDEIYDTRGLAFMRKQMERGAFERSFSVEGLYAHLLKIEWRKNGGYYGRGYMAPPAYAPTKLYNFANLHQWPSDGKKPLFCCGGKMTKFGALKKDVSLQVEPWERCPLRCAHMCFFNRSSKDLVSDSGRRLTPEDVLGVGRKENQGNDPRYNMRTQYRRGPVIDIRLWEEVCN